MRWRVIHRPELSTFRFHVKSNYDTYLRDYLTVDIYGNQSSVAQVIFHEKVLKSYERNSSILLNDFIQKGELISYYTKKGVYLGEYPSVSLSLDFIEKQLFMIAQGLFYDHRKKFIPPYYKYKILRHDIWDFKDLWNSFSQLNINGPRIFKDIFGCAYASTEEDAPTTIWLMWFYNKVIFSVSIENPEISALTN